MFTPTQRKAALSSMLVLLATVGSATAQGLSSQVSASRSVDPSVKVEYLLAKCAEIGWLRITHFVLAGFCAQFLITWAVSRLLAGKNGTLMNNIKYFFMSLFAWVMVGGIAGVLTWLGVTSGSAVVVLLAVVAALLVLIFIAFALPMKIFEIGFLRTVLFLILAVIGTGLAQAALSTRLPNPFSEVFAATREEQDRMIADWHTKRQRGPSAGGMLLATPENLQLLYTELEQNRAVLDPNDTPAVVAFNQKVTQYNIMRAKLDPQFLPKALAPITPVLPKKRTN
ncbi:hypothetical protein ACXR0O_10125 [Verrucomicrobiota bacterium sgz303538]